MKITIHKITNTLCCVCIMLIMIGCEQRTINYYYVETASIYSEKKKRMWNDSIKYINYYANGNVMFKAYVTDTTRFDLEGLYETYYPDGFPKERCMMSEGINVTPQKNGKHSGYDIKIDFGPYDTLPSGNIIRPFRTFVDGVSPDEYIVAVEDTGGCDSLPHQMPKVMREYKITYKNGDTTEAPVDESMYTYYIEDLDRLKIVNSNGDMCFLIYFYYKSIFDHSKPNDKRMVLVHDSLNWEVVKFEFE